MTTKIKGTEGIEFPDSAVQSSAAYTKAQQDLQNARIPVAVGVVSAAGALVLSNGFASASRISAGVYDVVFSTPLPNSNYAAQVTCDASSLGIIGTGYGPQSNGTKIQVRIYDATGTAADNQFSVCVWKL